MSNDKKETENDEKKLYASVFPDGAHKGQKVSADHSIDVFLGDDTNNISRMFYVQIERNDIGGLILWVNNKRVEETK